MAASKAEQKASAAESRIRELEALHRASEDEVTQLKRDKVLLVEHVADLQKKVNLFSISAPANISTQFLLQSFVCVVCVCVCLRECV